MAISVQIDVAAGITTALNVSSSSFSQTFTALRHSGQIDMVLNEDLVGGVPKIHVDIVPFTVKPRLVSRSKIAYLVVTTICVRKMFLDTDFVDGVIPNSKTDPLFDFVQEIHDFFVPQQPDYSGHPLADCEVSWQEGSEILCPYGMYLKDKNQFTGVVRVPLETYRSAVKVVAP